MKAPSCKQRDLNPNSEGNILTCFSTSFLQFFLETRMRNEAVQQKQHEFVNASPSINSSFGGQTASLFVEVASCELFFITQIPSTILGQ